MNNMQTPRYFLKCLAIRRSVRALNLALAAGLFMGGAVSGLRAADGTWAFDGNGTWSDFTNWQNGVVADGAGSTANFTFDITANRTVQNDAPRTIGNLVFDDTGTGTDSVWTVSGAADSPLTFSTASGTSTITANSNVGYGNEFQISAPVTGTNNLVFNSTTATTSSQRYLSINNATNSYTGTTTVSNGFLDVGANNILAAGSPLGVSNSAIIVGNANTIAASGSPPTTGLQVFTSGAAAVNLTIDRNIDSSATADVGSRTDIRYYNNTAAATGTLTISGNWTLGANTTHSYGLDAQQVGQIINFTGAITGPTTTQAFRINDYGQGVGTIRLSNAANSYAGVTTVERGTLLIANNAVSGTGASPVGANTNVSVGSSGVTPAGDTVGTLIDGAFTVGKNMVISSNGTNVFTTVLGGSQAAVSSFTGNLTTNTSAGVSRSLNLSQVAGGTVTFAGTISANGTTADTVTTNVDKIGAGTVALAGNNTYDGITRINAGTLLANNVQVAGVGSATSTGSVTVGVVSPAVGGQTGNYVNAGTGAATVRQINGLSNAVVANLQLGEAVTGTGITAGSTITGLSLSTATGTSSITLSTTFSVPASTTTTFTDLAFGGAATSAGTLGGTGFIVPGAGALVTVNTGSTLAPGTATAPGMLSIAATQTAQPTAADGTASLNLLAGSNLAIKLNGAAVGTGYSQVNLTGTVALGGGTLTLTLNGLTATDGQKFIIINNDGSDTVFGTFSGLADGSTITASGQRFVINYNAVGGADGIANDVVLTASVPVPEPGTWAAVVIGLGALGLIQFRRTRAA